MEEELKSILPFLPVVVRSGSLYWSSQAVETLKHLSKGPEQSRVYSGQAFFEAMSDLRRSISLFPLNHYAAEGYALFFEEIMSREDTDKWFGEVLPALAKLLLLLPTLLQDHYQHANKRIPPIKSGLRLLHSQQSGIVFLTQELISALLGCSLLCLFPVKDRSAKQSICLGLK